MKRPVVVSAEKKRGSGGALAAGESASEVAADLKGPPAAAVRVIGRNRCAWFGRITRPGRLPKAGSGRTAVLEEGDSQ